MARSPLRPRLILVVATAFGLLATLTAVATRVVLSRNAEWLHVLMVNMGYWYGWAALTPLVLWLAARYRIEGSRWVRSLMIHLAMSLLFGGVHVALQTGLEAATGANSPLAIMLFGPALITFDWEVMIYWAIVGLSHAIDYHDEAQQRALAASKLEARLMEARLQALQRQLQPHFLFNTLHAISALMYRDVAAADRMLARLSELLRLTLEQGTVQQITLRQELHLLTKYVEIEQVRFGDRLQVDLDVDEAVIDAPVPCLILQPLVENAIRHGIAPRRAAGKVTVRARPIGESLQLDIEDNGRGMSESEISETPRGVGLTNTRARLEHLYGAHGELKLTPVPGGGLLVAIRIPWLGERLAPVAPPPMVPA